MSAATGASEQMDNKAHNANGNSTVPGSFKSLIDDKPWDCYDLDSLLPLKEVIQETKELGFLLRHYWIPATELRFRQSLQTDTPDGKVDRKELQIDRRMARCLSNECLWREAVYKLTPEEGNGERSKHLVSEMLCSYDCYEQTYVSDKPIQFAPPTADQKEEARRQSLYCLPMLIPPGPVPIGFSWYGKVGDDYMNYFLEAEEQVGETTVLVIRREGRYTRWLADESSGSGNGQETSPMVTERKGVTLFAWGRAAVLEDRFLDQVVEAEGPSTSRVGTTSQSVIRLVRSCPSE